MAKKRTTGQVLNDLQRRLERHRREYEELVAYRDELAEELAEVEVELEQYRGLFQQGGGSSPTGGAANGRRPASQSRARRRAPRGQNTMTLFDAIEKVLKNRTLGVTEIATAVQKAGYKTKSNNFTTIVNQTLIKNPKTFKKVAHGQYTAA